MGGRRQSPLGEIFTFFWLISLLQGFPSAAHPLVVLRRHGHVLRRDPSQPANAYQIGDGQAQVPGVASSPAKAATEGTSEVASSSSSPCTPRPTSTVRSTMTGTIRKTVVVVVTASGLATQTSLASSLTTLSPHDVQSATQSVSNIAGSFEPSVSGNSSVPFATVVPTASTSLSLLPNSTSGLGPTASPYVSGVSASDIFQAIDTNPPPSQWSVRNDHPVKPLGIKQQTQKLQTNNFYSNFFLGDQKAPSWTHPYSLAWGGGTSNSGTWGLAVTQFNRSSLQYGPSDKTKHAGNASYFEAPLNTEHVILSAAELGPGTSLTTVSLQAFSVSVNLVPSGASSPTLTFPVLQGMGMVTGLYHGGTPLLQSGHGFDNITYVGPLSDGAIFKYRTHLQNNGGSWLIYVVPKVSSYQENAFTLLNATKVQGPSDFHGYIQLVKVPDEASDAESVYDETAGVYPVSANLTASVDKAAGSYTFSWTKQGITNRPLLMWALPHHQDTFDDGTKGKMKNVQLATTTKGYASAVCADSWTLVESNLPIDMGFAPWAPGKGDLKAAVPDSALTTINDAGLAELSQNMTKQSMTGSLYYDGKALAKFAAICYVAHDIGKNASLALAGLKTLQDAFAMHVNNNMSFPLVYDSVWGGAVSQCSYGSGDSGCDFGNTFYNDHHFHYGYFVYAAAVIGYLDPKWIETNQAWVNALIRDYANPITSDPYFPFSRNFDWFHGHSWAHGLEPSTDGTNQESSSEDTMSIFAMKMWGWVTNNTAMEARGNLILAIQANSLNKYFLYTSNNTIEPASFIPNKVAGILFENKIDHATFFGGTPQYVQGIHMLPLMPFSTYIRSTEFVKQDWDAYFGQGGIQPVDTVEGGWRGILMANLAIVDPKTSYAFFSGDGLEQSYLDSGASRTWYLAFAAALGGGEYWTI